MKDKYADPFYGGGFTCRGHPSSLGTVLMTMVTICAIPCI